MLIPTYLPTVINTALEAVRGGLPVLGELELVGRLFRADYFTTGLSLRPDKRISEFGMRAQIYLVWLLTWCCHINLDIPNYFFYGKDIPKREELEKK